jgi:hypothetical protein
VIKEGIGTSFVSAFRCYRYKGRLCRLETQLTALGRLTPEAIERLPEDKVDRRSRASSEAKVGRYNVKCGGQIYQLHCPLRTESRKSLGRRGEHLDTDMDNKSWLGEMNSRLLPTRRSGALDRLKRILPVVADPEPFLARGVSHRVACRSGRDKGTTGFITL